MSKWIMAIAAIATLTSVTSVSTIPAQAQNCITFGCAKTPNGGGGATTSCDAHLGYLRQVFKPQIAGIDDDHRVWVTELCSDFGLLSSEGNAAYLRTTIAQNDVLVEALGRKAYKPEDVFAVQMMGDDTINLFVHRFGS
jgi:hypothetical protein